MRIALISRYLLKRVTRHAAPTTTSAMCTNMCVRSHMLKSYQCLVSEILSAAWRGSHRRILPDSKGVHRASIRLITA